MSILNDVKREMRKEYDDRQKSVEFCVKMSEVYRKAAALFIENSRIERELEMERER